MCGRYSSTAAFDELALRFGITVESGTNEELTARYNVAPSQTVPIVTASAKGRRLVTAKWGFRPAWAPNETWRRLRRSWPGSPCQQPKAVNAAEFKSLSAEARRSRGTYFQYSIFSPHR